MPQDAAEAARWYRLAAGQGLADAQFSLGDRYESGKGVPQDYLQAHMWYNLAAAQGQVLAREGRSRVERKLTPSAVLEAQRLAREWKAKVE